MIQALPSLRQHTPPKELSGSEAHSAPLEAEVSLLRLTKPGKKPKHKQRLNRRFPNTRENPIPQVVYLK